MKNDWLMGSPWPILIIVVAYLYFVLKAGPELMKFRNPINVDRIVMIYDIVQVLFSLYFVKEVTNSLYFKMYLLSSVCTCCNRNLDKSIKSVFYKYT